MRSFLESPQRTPNPITMDGMFLPHDGVAVTLMYSLPLFPLNTVLFPGLPITLHIFEERYKLMINDCIRSQQPFGVVLLQSGSEVQRVGKEPKPYRVGCSALIAQSQPVGSGRMNIAAIGQERFQIHEFDTTRPYLVGEVDPYPLGNPEPLLFSKSVSRLRPWVDRYLSILEKTENVRITPRQLPQDDLALAYLAASLLKIDLHEKQKLLTAAGALEFTEQVQRIYRKEVTLSDILLVKSDLEYQGPFSAN